MTNDAMRNGQIEFVADPGEGSAKVPNAVSHWKIGMK